MALAKSSNKRTRDIQRIIHLTGGLLLVACIYTPLGNHNAFETLVRFVFVPVLIGTGMAMWLLPRLRKRLRDLPPGF
jgi:hypothetical protein